MSLTWFEFEYTLTHLDGAAQQEFRRGRHTRRPSVLRRGRRKP